MTEPSDRPLPLDMTERDAERVMNDIETMQNGRYENQRLIEILDCLRSIDYKSGGLSIQPASPSGHTGADPR